MRLHRLKNILFAMAVLIAGCGTKEPAKPAAPPWLGTVKASIASGDYPAALKELEDQTARVPLPAFAEEAWYLQGYLQAYGLSDFRKARTPLQNLVDSNPRHRLAAKAIRLLGDCYYFDSLYEPARRQYQALLEMYGDAGQGAYALYQTGNCWSQQDKPGEALTSWRDAVEKYPKDPWAVRSQLQVANMYVALDDPQMAKPELQKLLEMTTDPVVQAAVQESLKKLETGASKPGGR
jgi:tetratricopeptide (TPR) repeat protein